MGRGVPLTHQFGFEVGVTGELDAFDLRGRRVENARFGQFNIAHHIWVDGDGVVRYMVRPGEDPLERCGLYVGGVGVASDRAHPDVLLLFLNAACAAGSPIAPTDRSCRLSTRAAHIRGQGHEGDSLRCTHDVG